MGISIKEYLAGREPCDVCQELGEQHHCVTALLSRLDTCLIFNAIFINQDSNTPNDVTLLQALRTWGNPETVLDYYIRAEPVTGRINQRLDRQWVYRDLYNQFVKDLLTQVRAGQHQSAMQTVSALIAHAEQTY
jgi:hypothetical protein